MTFFPVMRPVSAASPAPTGTTVLLLHFDGSDASTTFTDSSSFSRTVTPAGNAQIDTAQSVFGGASGLFDGTGDNLSIPTSTDFDLGTGAWTMEFRVRHSAISANVNQVYIDRWDNGSTAPFLALRAFQFYYVYSSGLGHGIFRFNYRTPSGGGSLISFNMPAATQLATSTWYAVALVCDGAGVSNGLRCYLDGTQVGSSNTTDATGYQVVTQTLWIASTRFGGGQQQNVFGHIDELRITTGAALYTGASYTVATSAFTS